MPYMLRDKELVATKVGRRILGIPASLQLTDDKKRIAELEKSFNDSRRTAAIVKNLNSGSYDGKAQGQEI